MYSNNSGQSFSFYQWTRLLKWRGPNSYKIETRDHERTPHAREHYKIRLGWTLPGREIKE